jgi:hypothetical protein
MARVATDESGLCTQCGGHGVLMVRLPVTPENLDTLRPRARERAVAESAVWGSRRCDSCDGRDRVTPMVEASAEAAR